MVENTEYSVKTQRALSNYFEGLTEPVSLFIGTYDANSRMDKEASRDGNNALIVKTVEILRQNGIDAVPFFDKEAKSPDKVVVSKTGLQTPFIAPERAKEEAAAILTVLENNGIESLGFVTPNTENQLLYPARHDDIMNENKVLDIEKANPNPEKFHAIMTEHGSEFIKDMLDEALASPELKPISGDITAQMDAENRLHGCKTLYKGATQGANVFAVISPYEARNVPHASPKLSIAKGYSGLGNNASSKGGATYIDKETNRSYGFIYEIEAREDQKYYANIGLETADRELENAAQYFETPVMPHRNKVKAVYLHCGTKDNDFLFKVPENDPRWQDFMALHEPSDNTLFGYLAERRKQQKDDAKTAGHALTYEFNKHQALDIPDYRDLSNVSTAELLKSIARRVDIHQSEDGRLVVEGNVDLSGLDIRKLPNDFSNVKINGSLILSQNEQLEISSLDQLPETTKGIVSPDKKTTLNFGDLSQRSSEEVIAKLCGTEALVKNEEGFYPDLTFYGNIEKLPDDFKFVKAQSLNFLNHVEFETIHDIPETRDGFLNGLNIKNQNFEDVSPHEFLEKTRGNRYMGTFAAVEKGYIANGSGKIDGFVPEKLGYLDFSRSNIHNFPKGMESITLDAISLNPEYGFDSLDNFPKTLRGASGLELSGVSEKETAHSFLEKVWGSERLAYEAHLTSNDNIVVHNDLDLSNNKTNNIASEAIPHDFAKVKVGGRFILDSRSNDSYHIETNKRPTDHFMSEDKHIDLSGYTDRIIFDFGSLRNAEDVIMPKEVNEISFHQNMPPSVMLDCSGAKKLNISYYSDLSKASLIMPEKADSIEIKESTLCSGAMEIKNANSVELSNVSLQNTELHIEQNKHVNLQDLNFNEKSSLDCSSSESFWSHHCNLSALQDFKLPESSQSQINLYETKLPKGDYDFSKYEKTIGLNAVEFTPDSSIKLPQIEVVSLGSQGLYTTRVPECYQYGVELPRIKFPEMEWNLFDLKNNGVEGQEFLTEKEYSEPKAFADKDINLRGSDLSLVKNFRLPAQMRNLNLAEAVLPECFPDLSGAKYIDIAFADFSKCNQIKFPEKINDLNLQLIKFKDGVQLDVSGVENLYIHAQNLKNVGGLKFNPEGNFSISQGCEFPDNAELDFSKSKSVSITECDLSNIDVLRLPEGYDIKTNIIKTKLPQNVFIGKERYIVPPEERIAESVKTEEKMPIETVVEKKDFAEKTDIITPQAEAESKSISEPDTNRKEEARTYKLSEIRFNFRINGEKFNDPDGIIIDDRSYIRNKEMKEIGLTKQQRRSLIVNRRKENLKYLLGKIKTAAKNNKLAQSILKLRGIDTKNKTTASDADATHVIDFTETKEFEAVKETHAANNEAKSPNEAKISKRVKRIINIARGIIQPKKKQPATDKGRVSENDIARAAVTKEMANGGR